jgi:UDP-N-acetylmuramoyl-tripeptide--D-alanyl-D-alanine ligase
MNLTIGDVLTVRHLSAHNISMPERRKFSGVSTDSRTVAAGELFVALRGENFDGNRFVARAFRRGAAAAIVDSRAGRAGAGNKPVIVVRDGVKALGALASVYRRKFLIPVVAVAGSNGKTTAKEMIASVLAKKFRVLRTGGNLNNQIGVPLTLFGLRRGHEVAVIEIGTNHFGEVMNLAKISAPTHGIITNIGREHLRYFRDLDGVARAEGELYRYLEQEGGTVFVNADDPRLMKMAGRISGRMTGRGGAGKLVTYGFSGPGRSVRGGGIRVDRSGRTEFTVKAKSGKTFSVGMSVPGMHNASNGLSAAAVGLEFGVGQVAVRSALRRFRAVGKRMETVSRWNLRSKRSASFRGLESASWSSQTCSNSGQMPAGNTPGSAGRSRGSGSRNCFATARWGNCIAVAGAAAGIIQTNGCLPVICGRLPGPETSCSSRGRGE